jgi:hypothetical protein
MVNCTGTITLNGVTDRELIQILESKMKNEGKFSFSPSALQIQNKPNQETAYNNAILVWASEDGLKAVHEIIGLLLKKQASPKSVAVETGEGESQNREAQAVA